MLPSNRVLTELIGTLYDAAADASLWNTFLRQLAQITRADSARLAMHRWGSDKYAASASWMVDAEALRLYEQYYGTIDVWATRGSSTPAGSVCTSQALCPINELMTTEIYNDFAVRYGSEHGMFAIVENNPSRWASVSLFRHSNEFPASDLVIMDLLVPHLRRAFKLHFEFSELKLRSDSVEGALNMLAMGMIFVGGTAQVVLMNNRAEELLRQRDGLLMARREITASLSRESRQLRAIIDSAVKTASGKGLGAGGTLLVSRQKRRPLSITVAPLRPMAVPLPYSPAAVMFISDPEQNVELPVDMLHRCYGLTRAEARLTMLLLEGHSLKETADLCGVTYNTAKSQLKSIFSKTQVQRQSELVKLLVSASRQA